MKEAGGFLVVFSFLRALFVAGLYFLGIGRLGAFFVLRESVVGFVLQVCGFSPFLKDDAFVCVCFFIVFFCLDVVCFFVMYLGVAWFFGGCLFSKVIFGLVLEKPITKIHQHRAQIDKKIEEPLPAPS